MGRRIVLASDHRGANLKRELGKKLEAMRNENEVKRSKYQADLDRIERDLAAVEDRFAAAQEPPSGNGE